MQRTVQGVGPEVCVAVAVAEYKSVVEQSVEIHQLEDGVGFLSFVIYITGFPERLV